MWKIKKQIEINKQGFFFVLFQRKMYSAFNFNGFISNSYGVFSLIYDQRKTQIIKVLISNVPLGIDWNNRT